MEAEALRNSYPPFTREAIGRMPRRLLKESRSWFTPDVILLEHGGARYVLKDFSRCPYLVRTLWCRYAVRRESDAYQVLTPLAGVPRLVARIDSSAFVMEWLDAAPLPRRRGAVGMEFFRKLEQLVRQMHGLGIAHGDLRRKNVLVSASDEPCLIDFETCLRNGHGWLRNRFFLALARVDLITVVKLKRAYFPTEITQDEKDRLARTPWLLRLGRFIRKRIYQPVSPKILKRRWARSRSKDLIK